MKSKVTSIAQAVKHVKDGDTILLGGFLQGGCPMDLLGALYTETTAKDLTIVNNDSQYEYSPITKLMLDGRIKKLVCSYPGFNPVTADLFFENKLEVELSPQGTLAERIHAGGAGLGGVLSPTGLGTIVEEGKQVLTVDGKDYILEKPIRGNVAFIYSTRCDEFGNIFIYGDARNFNTVMATAADYVIALTNELVVGEPIPPEYVTIPGVFVDAIVVKEGK